MRKQALICVGGVCSNSGKTSVVELLLKTFSGWTAVKVTPCRPEHVCPHEVDCGACEPPESGYEIIESHETCAVPGKDTARFLEAGASRVAWVRSRPDLLPDAIREALARFSDAPGVIIESTTAIPLIDGLRIMVAAAGEFQIKDSANACRSCVDILAVNARGMEDRSDVQQPMSSNAGVIHINAKLSPKHPLNREFIEACRVWLQADSLD